MLIISSKSVSNKKLILNSHGGNYCDYMDHHFDSPHNNPDAPVWNRNSRIFPDRQQGFEIMERAGFAVPQWGQVPDLKLPSENDLVVVYTDPTYHQGMHKFAMPHMIAMQKHPTCLAAEFIDCYNYRNAIYEKTAAFWASVSHRYLMIGESAWALEYRSEDDWRSNVGEVDIEVLGEITDERKDRLHKLMIEFKSPLIAIDLVPCNNRGWLATDFNLAPGLHNSGIKDFVPAAKAAELIKDFYYAHCL